MHFCDVWSKKYEGEQYSHVISFEQSKQPGCSVHDRHKSVAESLK